MKKGISVMLVLIMTSAVLAGCGTKDADTTTLFVGKKGAVEEVSVGGFEKDNYDESELRDYIKDSIDAYKDGDGSGTVKLGKLSVSDGTAKLDMKYSDSTAYTSFVGEEVFAGTVVQAIAAGYDFDTAFKAVKDGKIGDMAAADEVMGQDDCHVVILSKAIDVSISGSICYVSGNIKVNGKDTATVESTEMAQLKYIIYK